MPSQVFQRTVVISTNLGGAEPEMRFVHNGNKLIRAVGASVGRLETADTIFVGTLEQCNAEIERLNLKPL